MSGNHSANVDLSSEVAQSVRSFLARNWDTRLYRELETGWSTSHQKAWDGLASLGWTGLLVSERRGGAGRGFQMVSLLARELGRALAPLPLATTCLAAEAIDLGTDVREHSGPLNGILGGEMATLALMQSGFTPKDARPLMAKRRGDGLEVTGAHCFVPAAGQAGYALIEAGIEGVQINHVFLVLQVSDPSVSLKQLKSLDWAPTYEICMDRCVIPRSAQLNCDAPMQSALRNRYELTQCFELIGTAETAHAMAVEYAKTRIAFGQPIGSFQAIKHKLVDLYCDLSVALALCEAAAETDSDAAFPLAAYWCRTRLRRIPEGALQVFGGIGYTWDHDIHLYLRRAAALTASLGESSRYRDRAASAIKAVYSKT